MEQLLNRLLIILDDQTGLYRSLLAVYEEERQCLLAFDLEGITAASKMKENMIPKVKILEEQRVHITNQLANILQQPASELTITRLAEKIDIRFSYKLSAAAESLTSILEQLKIAHSTNRSLITHSQELISSSLAFLHSNLTPDPVYHQDGRVARQAQCGRLVARTI